jgi:hypothetical protein
MPRSVASIMLLVIGGISLAGCSAVISLDRPIQPFATVTTATLPDGQHSVEIYSIGTIFTGRSALFSGGPKAPSRIFLSPGRYSVNLICLRGFLINGKEHNWLPTDSAPPIFVKVKAGDNLVFDCHPTSNGPGFFVAPASNNSFNPTAGVGLVIPNQLGPASG